MNSYEEPSEKRPLIGLQQGGMPPGFYDNRPEVARSTPAPVSAGEPTSNKKPWWRDPTVLAWAGIIATVLAAVISGVLS